MLSLWLIWLLLLLAAAGPPWIGEAIELPNSGRDLMLAVDISGSMQIEDMQHGPGPGVAYHRGQGGGRRLYQPPQRRPPGPDPVGSNAYLQSPEF